MGKNAKEGSLYRTLTVFGRTFDLYYGYYEERERHSKYNDPIPIYPDFKAEPQYTDEGLPFVTAMQDPCRHYEGNHRDDSCHSCRHFRAGEDLIGACACPQNQERKNE